MFDSKTASVSYSLFVRFEKDLLSINIQTLSAITVGNFGGQLITSIVPVGYLEPSTSGGISAFRLGEQQYDG